MESIGNIYIEYGDDVEKYLLVFYKKIQNSKQLILSYEKSNNLIYVDILFEEGFNYTAIKYKRFLR